MIDLYEGNYVIPNEDGSTTHITVETEPAYEPMSRTSAILWVVGTAVASALVIGTPIALSELADKAVDRKMRRDRQRLNKEIFDQIPA
jgi:hypothetical protein